MMGWQSRRLEAGSSMDLVIYFNRKGYASIQYSVTIDTKAKDSDQFSDRLNGHIYAIMQAWPLLFTLPTSSTAKTSGYAELILPIEVAVTGNMCHNHENVAHEVRNGDQQTTQ